MANPNPSPLAEEDLKALEAHLAGHFGEEAPNVFEDLLVQQHHAAVQRSNGEWLAAVKVKEKKATRKRITQTKAALEVLQAAIEDGLIGGPMSELSAKRGYDTDRGLLVAELSAFDADLKEERELSKSKAGRRPECWREDLIHRVSDHYGGRYCVHFKTTMSILLEPFGAEVDDLEQVIRLALR